MREIFEFIMLACFGLSWPISVWKSIRSRSTQGKSLVFIVAIIVGYVSGIIGKIVGGQVNYVLIVYCFNLAVVTLDLCLYFVNRRRERTESGECGALRDAASPIKNVPEKAPRKLFN